MRIEVDRDKCTGIGMCQAYAPDIFEIDDDGELSILSSEIPDGSRAPVEVAVNACPTAALRLEPSLGDATV